MPDDRQLVARERARCAVFVRHPDLGDGLRRVAPAPGYRRGTGALPQNLVRLVQLVENIAASTVRMDVAWKVIHPRERVFTFAFGACGTAGSSHRGRSHRSFGRRRLRQPLLHQPLDERLGEGLLALLMPDDGGHLRQLL